MVGLILSLSFHEAAHAWTANKLGDPTARMLGRLTLNATQANDYTLIMGATLFFAFLTMFGNLLADILYSIADPRIGFKS